MTRRLILGLLAALSLAVGFVGYDWYRARDLALGEAPPRQAGTAALPETESEIALTLTAPFSVLEEAAARAVPARLPFAGEGPERCARFLGQELCAGTRYQGAVDRSGAVDFARTPAGALRLAVPLTVAGDGGLTGDGARLLRLERRSFRAGLVAEAALTLDLDARWCPQIAADVGVRWTTPPRVEIVNGAWVDVGPLVERPLRAALGRLPDLLREAVGCDLVRRQVERLWRTHVVALALPNAPVAQAVVTPRRIGFSGLTVAPDHLRLGVRLHAVTQIAAGTPPQPAALPELPALERTEERAGRLDLALPVRADYAVVRDLAARQLVGREIPLATPLGRLTVRPRAIEVYPAGDRIAITVDFSAALPWRLFDATGRFTVTARPGVDETGRRLALTEVAFARAVDNPAWAVATAALETEIQAALARAGSIDLSPQLERALGAVNRGLADPARTGGVQLRLVEPALTLQAIVPEAEALGLLVRLRSGVEAELVRIELRR